MLRKSLIAAFAATTLAFGLTAAAPDAEARHRHNHHGGGVQLYFGFPGYSGGNGYYDDDWGHRPRYHRGNYHCHWVKVKRKHHKYRTVKRCHSARHHDRW